MSFRINNGEIYSGAFLVSPWYGLGVPGNEIPSTGDSGAAPPWNDGIVLDKDYRISLVTPPTQGVLRFYPDTSFEFSGAPDGVFSFTINGYEDSLFYGQSTASLTVGGASGLFSLILEDTTFSGGGTGNVSSSLGEFQYVTESPTFLIGGSGVQPSQGLYTLALEDTLFSGGATSLVTTWPLESDVRMGVKYGPTGIEYTGSLPSGSGTYPTAEQISQELVADLQAQPLSVDVQSMSGELESGYSIADAIRLLTSVLLGKVQGAGSGTERFRDLSDTKDRVVAVVDTQGNRESIYRDPTV